MFGNLFSSLSYKPDLHKHNSDISERSLVSIRSEFFPRHDSPFRRESKLDLETKVQRASSLIEAANIEELEPPLRSKTEYKHIRFVIFPDDLPKIIWDLYILILMLYTITIIPYRIAFNTTDSDAWLATDLIIDCSFMIDVLINCISAYYKNEDELEVSRKKIFLHYLTGWMLIDIVSSIPFQLIFNSADWKALVRFGRLPRLYRLIKLIKFLKTQQGISSITSSLGLNLPLGIKRLFGFSIAFFLICHLIACFWYFISTVDPNFPYNWVRKYGIEDSSTTDKYIASLYWTITTLSTVGYGDITPANSAERGICIFVMLGGVVFYSYTVSIIASVMSDIGKKKAKLDSKLLVLQDISQRYSLGKSMIKKIKKALVYDQSKLNKEKDNMIAALPKKLALQLNLVMNKKLVEKNKFLEDRPIPFINMILTCLQPIRVSAKDIVFNDKDSPLEMYFVAVGELACYITYNNVEISFKVLTDSDYCGDIAVILSRQHEFSVKTLRSSELLALTREDLFNKVITLCGDELKVSLIAEANNSLEVYNKSKEFAISEYVRTKNLVKAVSNESKPLETPVSKFNSVHCKRKLNNIRRTLPPRTINMLDSAKDHGLDTLRKEISVLALRLVSFQNRVKNAHQFNRSINLHAFEEEIVKETPEILQDASIKNLNHLLPGIKRIPSV